MIFILFGGKYVDIEDKGVSELEDMMKRAAQRYYAGEPLLMTDQDFDTLTEVLRAKQPDNKTLQSTGWGFDPMAVSGNKVKLRHPYGGMGSIDNKPRKIEDVPDKFLENVVVSAKLDGISCGTYFVDGKLVSAITRGDGEVGVDITHKLRHILGEDFSIPEKFTGAIRGELVIPNNKWEVLKSKGNYKSARNAGAGIIMGDDIEDLEFVHYVVYKIIAFRGSNLLKDTFSMSSVGAILNEWFDGAQTSAVPYHLYLNLEHPRRESLVEDFEKFKSVYPCDGCVMTSNAVKCDRDEVFHYDEVAYKFDGETATSVVKNVEWALSRTGKLVPTVIIEPVELSGATIQRASGFNAGYINSNKIGEGAVIRIMRSGEVIPDIQDVVTPSSQSGLCPDLCPHCGSELEYDGVNLWCRNGECVGATHSDLLHWCKLIADVHGMGDSMREKFFEDNSITSVEDIYYPANPIVFDLDTHQGRKAKEMYDILTKSEIDPIRALQALNIPRLGETSARKLVDLGIWDISEISEDSIKEISSSVGEATAVSIVKHRDKCKRLNLIKDRISVPEKQTSGKESKGSVVVTGKLSMKRKDFEDVVKASGYVMDSSIKKTTTYLITNDKDSGSSKNKKAQSLGIPVITEQEFLDLISEKHKYADVDKSARKIGKSLEDIVGVKYYVVDHLMKLISLDLIHSVASKALDSETRIDTFTLNIPYMFDITFEKCGDSFTVKDVMFGKEFETALKNAISSGESLLVETVKKSFIDSINEKYCGVF